jgi:hypothetical protein
MWSIEWVVNLQRFSLYEFATFDYQNYMAYLILTKFKAPNLLGTFSFIIKMRYSLCSIYLYFAQIFCIMDLPQAQQIVVLFNQFG